MVTQPGRVNPGVCSAGCGEPCQSTMLETAVDTNELSRSRYQRLSLHSDSPKTRARISVIRRMEPKLVGRRSMLARVSLRSFAEVANTTGVSTRQKAFRLCQKEFQTRPRSFTLATRSAKLSRLGDLCIPSKSTDSRQARKPLACSCQY